MLPKETYIEVVKNTPLVSIDLIIRDTKNRVLLGFRKNNPAKGTWFVPGGVIRKNELFTNAFKRVCLAEIGKEISLDEAQYIGLYEHIYPKNFADLDGFGTHYVVNAFALKEPLNTNNLPPAQHEEYWWATEDEILNHNKVHQNTKNYFNGHQPFSSNR